MILKKLGTEYKLYGEDNSCIATTQESPHKRLSKKNCDEIFGVIDVDGLAIKWRDNSTYHDANAYSYKEGFNKCADLNKGRVFTFEEVIICMKKSYGIKYFSESKMIENLKSLQQPTEIEVEIEMESTRPVYAMTDKGIKVFNQKEKLDENGCLILKKK